MSDPLDRLLHPSREWLSAVATELGTSDPERALRALRAALHALRDRIGPDEAVQLGAQLPTLIRGLFFEGWRPHAAPPPARDREEFLQPIHRVFADEPMVSAEHIAQAVFRVVDARVSAGEVADVKAALPGPIAALFPEGARVELTRPRRRRSSFRGRLVAALTRTPDAWDDRAGRLWPRLVRTTGVLVHRHGLEPARLEGDLTRTPEGQYTVRLLLDGSTDQYRAEHVDDTLPAAMGRCFDKLFGELDLRRTIPRPEFRAEVIHRAPRPARPVANSGPRTRDPALTRALPALERAAVHEVALLQAEGVIDPGQLDPAELVDEVVVDVLPQLQPGMEVEEVAFRLQDRLHERVAALRVGDAPEGTGGEISALALSIRDYRTRDEDWILTDVHADAAERRTDELVADREVRHVLMNALFHLPDEDRRVFAAVVIDGLSVETAAGRGGVADAQARLDRAFPILGGLLSPATPLSAERVTELYGALRA